MKLITVAILLTLAFLQYKIWLSSSGLSETLALRKSIQSIHAKNTEIRNQNAILVADIEDLKNGTQAIEERARSELGMIKPGEAFYQIVEK